MKAGMAAKGEGKWGLGSKRVILGHCCQCIVSVACRRLL
jgi:hypothetical protein